MSFKTSTLIRLNTEKSRQLRKWGKQNLHPFQWMSVLGEEVGEACKDANDEKLYTYQDELIQVAAVALSALENVQEQLCKKHS